MDSRIRRDPLNRDIVIRNAMIQSLMTRFGVYLGANCAPNMEAYLDARLGEWEYNNIDLIVTGDCSVPAWLVSHSDITVQRYERTIKEGIDIVKATYDSVKRYINEENPAVIRQVTQPRWHAPGVLAAAVGVDISTETRASSSMFTEFHSADNQIRSYIANNLLGRAIFLSDVVHTPKYGAISVPWWGKAERNIEIRKVNQERFSEQVNPLESMPNPNGDHVITVGRVSEAKGMDLLLEVSELLPDLHFTTVGDIRDKELADSLHARSNITVHEPVPYIDMPKVYAAGDVLLSVSRLEWGGVSRAMLEARATDTPVLALNKGDAETVADMTTDENSQDISANLKRLLNRYTPE